MYWTTDVDSNLLIRLVQVELIDIKRSLNTSIVDLVSDRTSDYSAILQTFIKRPH